MGRTFKELNQSTLCIKIYFVPHREHYVLPFAVEIGACCYVHCCESHTEHINKLFRQNVAVGGIYCNRCGLKGYFIV